jgi:hypothetical protein
MKIELRETVEQCNHDGSEDKSTLMAVGGYRDAEIMTRIRLLERQIKDLQLIVDRMLGLN